MIVLFNIVIWPSSVVLLIITNRTTWPVRVRSLKSFSNSMTFHDLFHDFFAVFHDPMFTELPVFKIILVFGIFSDITRLHFILSLLPRLQ